MKRNLYFITTRWGAAEHFYYAVADSFEDVLDKHKLHCDEKILSIKLVGDAEIL